MMLSDPDLWGRLQTVAIGPEEAALSFADRLARDNGWRTGFACRVIEEYRRFLYLCCVAGRPVTPSDQVDQAWHQHLTYTRSYWDDLCRGVLDRPLHHGPTLGGPEERARYDVQYGETLERYRQEFGEAPPADIWPEPAIRFGRRHVRIDRDAVWLIDKARYRQAISLGGLFLALGLTACAQIAADVDAMSAFERVAVVVLVGAAVAALVRWSRMTAAERARQSRDDGGCGSGCGDCGCGGGCD